MRSTLAQTLAESSIVLLKNQHELLPLAPGQKLAVFGRGQVKTAFSGNGSGASRGQGTAILDALEQMGLEVFPSLASFYREQSRQDVEVSIDWDLLAKTGNSGLAYELFGQYHPPAEEYPVPAALLSQGAEFTDTALVVLTRNSGGEECDRRLLEDYALTASEQTLIAAVCQSFSRVALVLNCNGQMDLAWAEQYPQVESILFLGIPGEDGAAALANVITGAVNPSGRLAFSLFRRYEDCPAARDFSFDKENPLCYEDYGLAPGKELPFRKRPVTVYREGAFGGYRTLGEPPLYPFGWGLSYTDFSVSLTDFAKAEGCFSARVRVTNLGRRAGARAVLLYHRRAVKKLWGFGKSRLLDAGESQELTIPLPYRELMEYDETAAQWHIPPGDVAVLLEDSVAASLSVPEEIWGAKAANRLGLQRSGKLTFARTPPPIPCPLQPMNKLLLPYDLPEERRTPCSPPKLPLLTDRELAALCVGYGPGVPFSALSPVPLPNTLDHLTECDHPTGALGYLSPAIPAKGIHCVHYKDGPAGLGGVAWPTEMLLGCCFDRELMYRFGDAVGAECEEQGVDVWLAPAVNLHRNPLCGRNFEYFSEDPLLTGTLAVAVARGVQENHPVLVCPKHFAANEQETCRRGSEKRNFDAVDSIVEEKTLREVYLKPFQMLVQEGNVSCIMTAFNKINGTFCGGSRDLCTHILREEWGFAGCVVTDWGDMDTVVDGADAVAAGNDVVMPGGPPVIEQILRGLEAGRVRREDLETAVGHLLTMLERLNRLDK